MLISRIAGNDRPSTWGKQQYVGCEIEVERSAGDAYYTYAIRHGWGLIPDGSLRNNGRELVSPPLPVDTLVEQLAGVYEDMRRAGSGGSIRTGIHLHFDMLDRTLEQVLAICTVYSLVEPALYAMLPPDRDHGIYCIPWYRAPSEAKLLAKLPQVGAVGGNRAVANHINAYGCKYSGLNVQSLTRLGTLEFRMAPTFADAKEAQSWVRTIAHVVKVGSDFETPADVMKVAAGYNVAALLPLPGIVELAEKYDSYYCAEVLSGGTKPKWAGSPRLDFDDTRPEPKHSSPEKKRSVGPEPALHFDELRHGRITAEQLLREAGAMARVEDRVEVPAMYTAFGGLNTPLTRATRRRGQTVAANTEQRRTNNGPRRPRHDINRER